MKATIRFKGGAGSGHHGHQGRPGKRGGSTSSGGGSGGVTSGSILGVHGTNNASSILEEGFNIDRAGAGSGYAGLMGVGVYIDTEEDAKLALEYGSQLLRVSAKRDLNLYDASDGIQSLYTSTTKYGDPSEITKYLALQGYDGVKASGQIVIFDPTDVQIELIE